MEAADAGPPNRELYALLHLSPDASDEDIRKAYRQWAQVYHPDKYQDPLMKETATENFQRIREAYEILSDENKRQIYDIYGMEGVNSGLELGPRLSKVEEIKEELERLKKMKEEEKSMANFRPSGVVMANLSLPQFLEGHGLMAGMAMASQVETQLSKRNALGISGNLQVAGNAGDGAASAVFKHAISPFSSIELIASAGLRGLIGIQTTRHISSYSTATVGVVKSFHDGSINLTNIWTRQLSETSSGNINLLLGRQSSISVGWRKKGEKNSASGELKFGTASFMASAHYTRQLSSKSHGRIASRIGSTALEVEIGAGRKISRFSTVRMLYTIGIQGIYWKFELRRGEQKLIIPILLSTSFTPMLMTGAFLVPTSVFLLLKKFVLKPYFRKRKQQKALENTQKTSVEVKEKRGKAEKAQELLQLVANRKRSKQMEIDGLVITNALYGSSKALKKVIESRETNNEESSKIWDVTLPLNFYINDSGQLKLHGGVKKSGIMGFYDPCPGERNELLVEYTYHGEQYQVVVDDYEELVIPQEAHRI